MAWACPASFAREVMRHHKASSCETCSANSEGVSDAAGSESRIIRRSSVSHRHHPYAPVRKSLHEVMETQVQQQGSPPEALASTSVVWQAQYPCKMLHPDDQLQQLAVAGTLKSQPLEKLLDIAISLASRSLARTMDAFQAACQCWAHHADSDIAGHALDRAEACMTRTIHRMQIAQHLAAALIHREQQCHQQVQQAEYGKMLHMMQAVQRQQLYVVQEAEDEGEEEVCSSWRPAPVSK